MRASAHRTPLAVAGLVLVASCADEESRELDDPRLLAAEFTGEFHVGDEPPERQFANIDAMDFSPDGDLVVLDRGEFAVSVFDRDGREVARWGNKGEGPGEFRDPGEMAVSSSGVVAIDNNERVDLFTLEGSVIDSRVLGIGRITDLLFDGTGVLVVGWRPGRGMRRLTEPATQQVMRFDDGEVLWTSPQLPSVTALGPWSPRVIQAGIGSGRIVVGMSDRYEMAVLDVSSGRELGRIGRNVLARGPSEDFIHDLREAVIAELGAEMTDLVESLPLAMQFPMIGRVFVGPPGRTVWIDRLMGIGDSLAPPVGDSMDDWTYRLYDLFDGDSYEYVGTVEVPDYLRLMTGDSERVAGVHRDELDVESVRVLRVEVEEQPRTDENDQEPTRPGR